MKINSRGKKLRIKSKLILALISMVKNPKCGVAINYKLNLNIFHQLTIIFNSRISFLKYRDIFTRYTANFSLQFTKICTIRRKIQRFEI